MSTPIIEKTNDYSIFKNVGFNRDKKKEHIEALKRLILKENLLSLHPILVNEKMEVIDGQHRLEAAKDLRLDVFFIRSEISYDHILNSNIAQNKMGLSDVIKFYAIRDNVPDYLKIKEYIERADVNPKAIIALIFGHCSPAICSNIKSGKFQFPKDSSLIESLIRSYSSFVQFCKDKKITPISMVKSSHFTSAYRNLVLLDEFKHDTFLSKLSMRWFELKPQLNSKEWTKQLIQIYNWKNQNPIQYGE